MFSIKSPTPGIPITFSIHLKERNGKIFRNRDCMQNYLIMPTTLLIFIAAYFESDIKDINSGTIKKTWQRKQFNIR